MAFYIDENGDMEIVQCDSGVLTITALDTTKDYEIYFAIQDEDRNPIGTEVMVNSGKSDTVTFEIPAELTDLLTVDKDEDYAVYYYGIKLCCADDGLEDTLYVGGKAIGDRNTITVYPKKVEGTT